MNINCGALALKDYLMIFKNEIGLIDYKIETFEEIIDEAKHFDLELYPQQTTKLHKVTPCIAKVGTDHFVLVLAVENGNVLYSDNGISVSTPLDDFLYGFKGYVLSERLEGKALNRKKCKEIIGHKKGKDIFKGVLPILAGVLAGPLGPIAAGAISGVAKGATQGFKGKFAKEYLPGMVMSGFGAKAMQPGINAAKSVGGGYGSQIWQGGRSLLGMQPTSINANPMTTMSASGNPMSVGAGQKMYYNQGVWSPTAASSPTGYGLLGKETLGKFSPAQPGGTQLPFMDKGVGDIAIRGGRTTQGVTNADFAQGLSFGETVPATNTISPTSAATRTAGAGTGSSLLGTGTNLAQLGLGAGLLGGSMMPQMPEAPEYPSEIDGQNLASRVFGGSPLAQVGTERAMEIMQGDPMTEADEQAIIGQFERRQGDALASLDEQYNAIGRLNSGEHLEAKQKMTDEWENQKATLLYQARRDYQQMQNNVMQASWGYDLNQMNQILAYADRVGRKAEIDHMIKAGDVMGLKALLGQLSGLAFGGGLGMFS